MGVHELFVIPPVGAEPAEVDEGSERNDLEEGPYRHIFVVLIDDCAAVDIVPAAFDFVVEIGPAILIQACFVIGDYRISVFVLHFCNAVEDGDLLVVLDVE